MNERIKELVVKSGNGQMRDGRLYPHIGIRFEEDWQRFAELIIQDCISQIAIIGISNDENEDILWTVDLAILNIKDRFGMK